MRLYHFDILRGIAIIGVVLIHSLAILYTADRDGALFLGATVFRQLLNFSVPLFIFISGYFLYDKRVDTKEQYLSFVRKQCSKVLIPFVVWSLFYLLLYAIEGASAKEIITKFLLFQAQVPFYFIALIIQYYLFLPFLKKLSTGSGLLIAGGISTLSCIAIYYFRFTTEVQLHTILSTGLFPIWMVFFVLGLYLKKTGIKFKLGGLISVALIGIILSIIETIGILKLTGNLSAAISQIKLSSFMFALVFIPLLMSLLSTKRSRVFEYVGKISFGIYFSHMFFIKVVTKVLGVINETIDVPLPLQSVIIFIVAFSMSVLFALTTRKINKGIAIKYLGQ